MPDIPAPTIQTSTRDGREEMGRNGRKEGAEDDAEDGRDRLERFAMMDSMGGAANFQRKLK